MNPIKLYKWQQQAVQDVLNYKNVILSSPTGTGKTIVFLQWALEKKLPIIITAPIKALSNQRYSDLKNQGYNVAIETGDVKNKPDDWQILCCTQEIYTNRYCDLINVTLVIDEMHYIFENYDRTRSYVEALINSKAENIFVCSATFGNLIDFKKYIDFASNRKFFVHENKERITKLRYCTNKISMKNIKNALVVAFSVNGCTRIINDLKSHRTMTKNKDIDKLVEQLKISKKSPLLDYVQYGLAIYHGNLFPKEKTFIEKLFREQIIDTVVGTDALAYGVNFPIQKVVFCQLVKYYDGEPITRNMFEQISGRAGRKGYFDTGSVFYNDDVEIEAYGFSTNEVFEYLKNKKNENVKIRLTTSVKKVLNGTAIQDEINFIEKYSTDSINISFEKTKLKRIVKEIVNTHKDEDCYEEFQNLVRIAYSDELDEDINLEILNRVFKKIPLLPLLRKEDFKTMLRYRQFLHGLPKHIKKTVVDLNGIDELINSYDHTVLQIPL